MSERIHDIDRRQVLKWGAGLAVAAVVGTEFTQRPYKSDMQKAIEAAQMGSKYGGAILKHPGAFLDTVNLWLPPFPIYANTGLTEQVFNYRPEDILDNTTVTFGDSNAAGVGFNIDTSPASLFANKLKKKIPGLNWETRNFAIGEATTPIIEKQILSDDVRKIFAKGGKKDVWINAGGNDVSQLGRNWEEFSEIERIIRDPKGQPELLIKYGSRIYDSIHALNNNFSNLLYALNENYGSQIRHVIVISLPDYSKTRFLKSQHIDNNQARFPLGNSFVKDLARKVSIKANNELFNSLLLFNAQTGIRVVGIDTFEMDKNVRVFDGSQHYTREATDAIAEIASRRTVFADV